MLSLKGIKLLAEDFRLWLHRHHSRLSLSAASEARSSIELLNPEHAARLSLAGRRSHVDFLRSRLQSTPYWSRGHVELGELSLEADDVATAYASGQAAIKLGDSQFAPRARILLARCHLKRLSFDAGCKAFAELCKAYPSRWDLVEDLAASFIGLGRYAEAESQLNRIPEDVRSGPAKSALLFVREKTAKME